MSIFAKEVGFIKDLINGSYDIAMSGRIVESDYNVSHTYPINDLEIVIFTQHRKFLTPFEKIIGFYSIGVILSCSLAVSCISIAIQIN